MAFPTSFDYTKESVFVQADGYDTTTSDADKAISKDSFSGRKTGYFVLVYRSITIAEWNLLAGDYQSDPGEFSFTWDQDNTTHTVVWAQRPRLVGGMVGNDGTTDRWDAEAILEIVPLFSPRLLEDYDERFLEDNTTERDLEAP